MLLQLHQVTESDTLHGIARLYHIPVRRIKVLNALSSAKLSPGQTLLIGVSDAEEAIPREFNARSLTGGPGYHTVQAGETLYRIAQRYQISVEQLKRDNGLTSNAINPGQQLRIGSAPVQQPTPIPNSQATLHTVQAGETLYRIALRYQTTVAALKALNGLTSDTLSVGMQLKVSVRAGGNTWPQSGTSPTNPGPIQPQPVPDTGTGVSTNPGIRLREDASAVYLSLTLLDGKPLEARLIKQEGGFRYGGSSSVQLTLGELQTVGVSPSVYEALQFCKKVEGHYDAINTYDKGVFSYGFIQFAASQNSLDKLLVSMAQYAPRAFQQTFARAGMGISGGVLYLQTPQGGLSGGSAWQFLRDKPTYLVPFIQAGFERSLVLEQYRVANELYALPTLNANLRVFFANGSSGNVPVSTVFYEGKSQSLVVSMGVNLGVGGMGRVVSDVVTRLAAQYGCQNAADLSRLGWRVLCEALIQQENEQIAMGQGDGRKSRFTIERAQKLLMA
jgi:LysM repeat protein